MRGADTPTFSPSKLTPNWLGSITDAVSVTEMTTLKGGHMDDECTCGHELEEHDSDSLVCEMDYCDCDYFEDAEEKE